MKLSYPLWESLKSLTQQSFKLGETEKFLSMLKNYGNIKLENSHCGKVMVEMDVVSAIKLMSS